MSPPLEVIFFRPGPGISSPVKEAGYFVIEYRGSRPLAGPFLTAREATEALTAFRQARQAGAARP